MTSSESDSGACGCGCAMFLVVLGVGVVWGIGPALIVGGCLIGLIMGIAMLA